MIEFDKKSQFEREKLRLMHENNLKEYLDQLENKIYRKSKPSTALSNLVIKQRNLSKLRELNNSDMKRQTLSSNWRIIYRKGSKTIMI